jgi:hypothetical protein
MIQVELTRSSLLTPHSHGRGADGSQNISFDDLCPKEKAEPKQWDDEGAEDVLNPVFNPDEGLCLSHEDRAEHFLIWKRTATKRVHPNSKSH